MDWNQRIRNIHRRTFLGQGIAGLGLMALNSLIDPKLLSAATTASSHGVVNPLHFPPKAKRIIFLYQAGGPSHQGPADRATEGQGTKMLRPAAQV
jgi:hypothetical protein